MVSLKFPNFLFCLSHALILKMRIFYFEKALKMKDFGFKQAFCIFNMFSIWIIRIYNIRW
jgi:hypothetical protein